MIKVILASASPRRRELLTQIGMDFEVMVSDCEETITKSLPQDVVCELSLQKAQDVYEKNKAKHEEFLVIGADTIVVFAGKILGKPKDKSDAVRMLSALSGNTHTVYTGVTLVFKRDGEEKSRTFYEKSDVTFYPVCHEEILSYVESGEPMDKAGSYGIQGVFAAYVKEICGEYNNVVGLPVGRLYQELKECGLV